MYSQQELDDAVAAGVITEEAASALRQHIERQTLHGDPDEEQFRLLTGFNDIFVSIAAAILLFAVGWIGQSIGQSAGLVLGDRGPTFTAPLAVAATAWGLALYFTAKRRMALPSILLLLAFVGGVFATSLFALALGVGPDKADNNPALMGSLAAISGAIAAGAAWLHWRTFRVPITVAAGAAAVAAIAVGLLVAALGPNAEAAKNAMLGLVLFLGIGIFLFAMWWDSSDRARLTRRSDVAFWLHLLAAPMIVHPIFTLLGLNNGTASLSEGLIVVLLYVALGVTALAVDRPRLARIGAGLCPLGVVRAVQAVRSGGAQHRPDCAGHRLGTAAPVGLLAPGAGDHRPSAARILTGEASGPRPYGDYPTSRMKRRSSGASTPLRSWPRFSTTPCSPINANAPCFDRSSGRFSMRTSGRSECRR
jgi:MFS family permease